MIKLGFVAGTAYPHSVWFAGMFNGVNGKHKHLNEWIVDPAMARIEGARVVRVFDEDRQAAENMAKFADVPEVAGSLEEMFEGLDAVFIGDDLTMRHHQYAPPFLDRGIPTFLDKPFGDNVAAARALIDRARVRNCLFTSTSALVYAREFAPIYSREKEVGEIAMVCTMGPADLMWERPFVFYGMHAVTVGHYIIDDRPVEVVDVGQRGRTVVRVRYLNGAHLTVMCPHGMPVHYHALVQGTKGPLYAEDDDYAYFYASMLKDFLAMVEKKEQTFDLLKALEVLQICCAHEESVRTGKAVRLG